MFQREEPRPCLLACLLLLLFFSPPFLCHIFFPSLSLFLRPLHNTATLPPSPLFFTTSTYNHYHEQNSLLPHLPLNFALTSRHHHYHYHGLSPSSASTTNYQDPICHLHLPIPSTFTTTRYDHPFHPSPATSICLLACCHQPLQIQINSNINSGTRHRRFARSLWCIRYQ